LPAIWLIRDQLDHQVWSQVAQGSKAARALCQARQTDVENLAMLTAQRPTLHELLIQEDWSRLAEYLQTLQAGAGLDLIAVCNTEQIVGISPKITLSEAICKDLIIGGYHHFNHEDSSQIWFTSSHTIEGDRFSNTHIIVGLILDDNFALEMQNQTGLGYTFWASDQPVATSLFTGTAYLDEITQHPVSSQNLETETNYTFKLEGQHYYATRLFLDHENTIIAEIALGIAEITATQNRLIGILCSSILIVTVLVSFLGIMVARRISKPRVVLAKTATRFSQGDLNSPVVIDEHVSEVAQVAHALEHARVDLLNTMSNLRREKDWVEHLVASIVEGIMTLDHSGHITYFSQGAERITGWSQNEVINQSCDEIFLLIETTEPFSESIPPPGQRKKITVKLAEARTATLAITGAQLLPSDVKDAQVVLVLRDISEEEAVHRILGQFLANIAHEFHTPLSALEASIELLLDQASELNASELQELHTSLYLGTLRLHTLVDNLLESANIEARRFRVSPRASDLGNIIAEAVQTMQPLLAKYEQHLTLELPVDIPIVRADPHRMVQVLINLLSNASRYGPPGEEIVLRVTSNSQYGHVAVIDRGPGIPPEHHANLFQRFVYPHAGDAVSQAGAGLGLSVVKAIVTAHGGQVGVDDNPAGGSIFWFTLPISRGTE
ncbi:MAG: ATP-binding protein, partial [Anaerolineaceae bacterium]|nr:ATP-binding protein [Anaerolineaceae bacterium]